MKFGVSWVDISPDNPVMLDGFAARSTPHEGVLDPIYGRAVWIETVDGPLIVFVLDSTGLSSELRAFLAGSVSRSSGVPSADIVFLCTHTHYSPAGGLLRAIGIEWDYWRGVSARLEALAEEARRAAGRCWLSHGAGTIDISVNRRVLGSTGVQIGENAGDSVDSGLDVLSLREPDGRLAAMFSVAACHPVSRFAEANQVSSDFPAYYYHETAVRHPGCIPFFLNSGAADINPVRVGADTEAGFERVARSFADAVGRVTAREHGSLVCETVRRRRVRLDVPLNDEHARRAIEAMAASAEQDFAADTDFARYMRSWIKDRNRERTEGTLAGSLTADAEVIVAGEVAVAALPFEVTNDTAATLKSRIRRELGLVPLVVSYANDVRGYLPTRRMLEEGGYEPHTAAGVYGLPGIYSLTAEQEVVGAVMSALGHCASAPLSR